jgi:membrane protein DedA with SNARE-associated domain
LAILTWGVIMLSIGWLAGHSFFYTINIFDDVNKIIALAVGLIIGLYLVEAIIKRILQSK